MTRRRFILPDREVDRPAIRRRHQVELHQVSVRPERQAGGAVRTRRRLPTPRKLQRQLNRHSGSRGRGVRSYNAARIPGPDVDVVAGNGARPRSSAPYMRASVPEWPWDSRSFHFMQKFNQPLESLFACSFIPRNRITGVFAGAHETMSGAIVGDRVIGFSNGFHGCSRSGTVAPMRESFPA